jgi:signal transduction histidine kinase
MSPPHGFLKSGAFDKRFWIRNPDSWQTAVIALHPTSWMIWASWPPLAGFVGNFRRPILLSRIETKIHIQENDVGNQVKTVIYRIMQEPLNNISKHSKANLANLTLQKEENKIEFIIQDHGQGFDLNAVYSLKSSERELGLAGMKERTFLSGGSFSIESTLG